MVGNDDNYCMNKFINVKEVRSGNNKVDKKKK